jgi:2-amino-4-hydroxy-6-hydroxymethyldihydropteridine diphosphokinase
MPHCWIGLGGNQGNVSATFTRALELLADTDGVTPAAVSPTYRTAPMGALAGEPFLNAVAGCDTDLAPLTLLDRLQAVEHACGRVRTVHWGPRTLDLDLLAYGDDVITTPRLTVPHPGAWLRRFVLDPWAEIAGEFVHPVWRLSIVQLRDRLRDRRVHLLDAGEELLTGVRTALAERLPDVAVRAGDLDGARVGGLVVVVESAKPQASAGGLSAIPHLRVGGASDVRTILDAATAAFYEPVRID